MNDQHLKTVDAGYADILLDGPITFWAFGLCLKATITHHRMQSQLRITINFHLLERHFVGRQDVAAWRNAAALMNDAYRSFQANMGKMWSVEVCMDSGTQTLV
jgi:hypothetical protein